MPTSFMSFLTEQTADGSYDGLQSGNQFSTNDNKIIIKTKNGVRGRNIKCSVEIKNGKIVKHSLGDFLFNG